CSSACCSGSSSGRSSGWTAASARSPRRSRPKSARRRASPPTPPRPDSPHLSGRGRALLLARLEADVRQLGRGQRGKAALDRAEPAPRVCAPDHLGLPLLAIRDDLVVVAPDEVPPHDDP